MNRPKVLVFSVAVNGYQWLYRTLFKTHKAYAKRHSYQYQLVDQPSSYTLGMEVAWLKIYLIQSALRAGYEWVVFLDADTEVSEKTPNVESLSVPGKYIYMGTGYSGEFNSGVIIVKNSPEASRFIQSVIDCAGQDIPEKTVVNWGENSYVIHVAKSYQCVQRIDKRWNNNEFYSISDFIRHYSCGPLRKQFKPRLIDLFRFHGWRYWLAINKWLTQRSHSGRDQFQSEIDQVHQSSIELYPIFKRCHSELI